MKNTANAISFSRIPFAVGMVLAAPFSSTFWICYLCGGLSDLLDGYIARKLKQESAEGAKIDSIADLIFAASLFIVAVRYVSFPMWFWVCAILVALIRILNYSIGFYKYHAFSSLHTYMNKAAGALIFSFPLLYALIGLYPTGVAICLAAFVSAIEEMAIIIKSKKLNRDCKSIFA